MKKSILILAVLALLGQAGCGGPTPEEATAEFCASLQAFGESLTQLEQVTADTSVGDLKQARGEVANARQQVVRSANDLAEARVDSIDAAWQDLERTIDAVTNRDTLAEAAASITASAVAVRAAVDQVGSVACPELAGMAPATTAVVQESAAPALPVAAAPQIAGVYTGSVPPSNGSELAVTLTLHPNNDASLVLSSRPTGAGAEAAVDQQILEGTWSEEADGTVSVTLGRLADGMQLAIPEALTFARQEGQLAAKQFSQELFGPAGLTLQASTEATAGLPPSAAVIGMPAAADASSSGGAAASAVGPAALTGTTWQLLQMDQGSASKTVVPDPSLYTLTLSDDGSVVATADCNTSAGVYQVDGANLSLQIDWGVAACPPTSLARQFGTYLDYANAFLLQEDTLLIYYNNSAGTMTFAAAGP